MLTKQELRIFLEAVTQAQALTPAALLEPASHLIETQLLLVDMSSTVIYQPKSSPSLQQKSTEFPLYQAGQYMGKLIVHKAKLSQNEQVLLEILLGLLLASLEWHALSKLSIRNYA